MAAWYAARTTARPCFVPTTRSSARVTGAAPQAARSGCRSRRRGESAVRAPSPGRPPEITLRAYDEAYRVATELFWIGRGTTTDLIDADNELLAAKLATTNALIDLVIAAERLDYAIGAK
jgi:hypothetical protein